MNAERPGDWGSNGARRDLVPGAGWSSNSLVLARPFTGSSRDPVRIRTRVVTVGYATAILTACYLLGWSALHHEILYRADVWQELLGIALASLTLDIALAVTASDRKLPVSQVVKLGYVYFVLRCLLLSVLPVRLDVLAGFGPPRFTLACLAVVSLPTLIPTSPRRALGLCALGAATQPLAVLLWSPAPVNPSIVANSAVASTIAVFVGYVCARIAQGLRGAVERARNLGAYHLRRLIAQTDVSEVWLAHHHLLARPAAVKKIQLEGVTSEVLERFVREAQVTALLTSPHTVTLYDYGVSEEGAPYYAMELLEGEDLQKWIEHRGAVTAAEAIDIGLQACDSLEEAHQKGLVHRDLKPSNIYRCRSGLREDFIKVLDFGMAQFRPRSELHTTSYLVSPRVMGTPAYIVPEVVLGRRVDARSDIYQLGSILFFLLTGRPPFIRHSVELTCMAHVVDAAPRVSNLARHFVPPDLEAVVGRCLEKDPRNRFASAAELKRVLEALRDELNPSEVSELGRAARVAPSPPVPESVGHERLDRDVPGFSGAEETRASSLLLGGEGIRGQTARFVRERLVLMCELTALATVGYYVLWGSFNARGSPALVLEIVVGTTVSVTLDMGLAALSRSSRVRTRTVINAALVYLVLRALPMAMAPVRLNDLVGLEPPRMTFTCVLVGMFSWFVPVPPKKLIFPLIVAGAMQPLSLVVFRDTSGVGESTLTALVSIVVGYYVALVSHRLRREASYSGRLGSYQLVELIGKGAMGEVWRAKHQLLARPAAIKLMRAPPDARKNRALMRRFEREAQVTAALTSPHAVRVFDYGMSNDGALYFAMELLEGRDLGRVVREDGPLAPDEVVRVALETCDALAEAHALGLVHRDLKPENLMQAQVGLRDDFIKVLDFGIVELRRRLEQASGSALASAPIAGTPGYMAPEVITSNGADARADIYELGCVMFFLLTGRPVFEGANPVAVAMAHVTQPPPKVEDVLEHPIPPSLEAIVARCLAKIPSDRYSSVEELVRALNVVPSAIVVRHDPTEELRH